MGLGIKVPRNALSKAAKDFKDNPNGENVELEPGTYLAVITGMKGVETGKGPQIVVECKIGGDVDDKIKGGKVAMWFSFDEDRVIHLLRFLAKLGYDVEDLDAKMLEEHAEAIKEAKHVIRLKAAASKDGDYVNVRMNKVMADMDADEVLAGGGDAGEEGEEEEEDDKKDKKKKKDKDEEPEEEEEEQDLDDLDRDALKAILKKEEIEFKVMKSTEDDEIREAIKEARAEKEEAEEPEEEEDDKKKKKGKGKEKEEPEEEEEEEEDDKKKKKGKGKEKEEEAEEEEKVLKVGMSVKAKIKGETVKGKVVEIDHDEGKIVMKTADGKKFRLSPDKLED